MTNCVRASAHLADDLSIDKVHTKSIIYMKYKGYRIEFSEAKNLLLKETRGTGFEDVLVAIEEKKILGDMKHKKYVHQRILVIKREEYAYAVPYVIDLKRKVIFLKTVYPSRVLTDKYMKRGMKK